MAATLELPTCLALHPTLETCLFPVPNFTLVRHARVTPAAPRPRCQSHYLAPARLCAAASPSGSTGMVLQEGVCFHFPQNSLPRRLRRSTHVRAGPVSLRRCLEAVNDGGSKFGRVGCCAGQSCLGMTQRLWRYAHSHHEWQALPVYLPACFS